MGFKEDMEKLAVQIRERSQHVSNEETTKQTLIIPFLQVLGYDVFNPLEVRPEYIADFGKKKGEKVDYAIFSTGKPIMFIEAKSVNENLGNHSAQLSRYFNSTPDVKLAVLTNGMSYKFFTDLNSNNIMDESPFLQVNIVEANDSDIEVVSRFRKDAFDADDLMLFAEELIYTSNLNTKLKDIFKNPPDEFIRYLIKDFRDTRITSNVVERFRPIVKKSISKALLDIVSQGIFQDEVATSDSVSIEKTEIPSNEPDSKEEDNQPNHGRLIQTTEEEIRSFEYIRKILERNGRDISQLGSKDTTVYFAIYTRNILSWFIRLNLDSSNKQFITRLPVPEVQLLVDGFKVTEATKGTGESRVYIDSYEDINRLERLILACYDAIT